jgi:2-polyprenyl-3-methyl-5-hydroxy-6-metoxy-1,4-benzoquinol methylase
MGRPPRRRVPRTEERIFPPSRRISDGMLREHRARYAFAAPLLRGRVLDLGCGTGYGCLEFAARAEVTEIIGLDRSGEAVEWARRYYPAAKVAYVVADLEKQGWEAGLGLFDGIVAFEVLEHLQIERPFWQGVGRILRPGGSFWLSTPLGRGRGIAASDPFHLHQLRRSEVEALFGAGWRVVYYGQTGTWIEPWTAGRRYFTILARARRNEKGRGA